MPGLNIHMDAVVTVFGEIIALWDFENIEDAGSLLEKFWQITRRLLVL